MFPTKKSAESCIPNPQKIFISGEEILWYSIENTTSTMDVALELIYRGCPPWTAVTARYQTSGRGTHGRTWSSHTGKGLWLSLILPPPSYSGNLSGISLLAAGALVRTLEEFAECLFLIKYPNDIVVNDHKIAGIMVETATNGDAVQSVILGMGVNFRQTREDFLKEGLHEATSLLIETGSAPDREKFLVSFIAHLKNRYETTILEPDKVKTITNRSNGKLHVL